MESFNLSTVEYLQNQILPETIYHNLQPVNTNSAYNNNSSKKYLNCPEMNEESARNLLQLLEDWGFSYLYELFLDERMDVETLKTLNTTHLLNLCSSGKMQLGVAIKFETCLKKWQLMECTTESTESLMINEKMSKNNVYVKKILNDSPKGRLIINHFNKNNVLNDGCRAEILEIINNFLIQEEIKISSDLAKNISEQIVEEFPSEDLSMYYIKQPGKPAISKVSAKYYNAQRSLKCCGILGKRVYESRFSKSIKIWNEQCLHLEPEANHQDSLVEIANDNCSFAELEYHWNATKNYRAKDVAVIELNCSEIINKWPHYKKPLGYKLQTAKNIIIFVGAGMSAATITAARYAKGGENQTFSFEKYPWSGHARTYCIDSQTPDSACAGTAFLTGVKSNTGTINVAPTIQKGQCTVNAVDELESIAKWAIDAGKAVGFATTNRVTSGSAPSLYANTANSNWESNKDVLDSGCKSTDVDDIAVQLINGPIGKEFKVVLGGGRKNFIPTTKIDIDGKAGLRTDGRNLIEEWINSKPGNPGYIATNQELGALNTTNIDYLFGLFEYDRLHYNMDVVRDNITTAPSLSRMTHYSLEMLQKSIYKENGFLLFVEDALINEAHMENKPRKAIDQVQQFDNALGMARMMTSEDETLIIVFGSVGSTLSISGNSARGSEFFDAAGTSDIDSESYLKLSYATGPGYEKYYKSTGGREDPVEIVEQEIFPGDKIVASAVPLSAGVNGGEDVLVFASGPYSYLFSGAYEQSFIAHGIKYAACLDDYCAVDSSNRIQMTIGLTFLTILIKFIF